MSNQENLIGDAERQSQQLASEAAPSAEERGAPAGVAVEPTRNVDEVEMADVDEGTDGGVDVEDEYQPRAFSQILQETAGVEGIVRLVIQPELNFVVNLFADEVQDLLIDTANFEFNDQKLNLIQSLSKLNERSGRIGVLREPLREFVGVLSKLMANEERLVVTADAGALVVENLIEEHLKAAQSTLYANFPTADGSSYIELNGEDGPVMLPADDYIRVRPLLSVSQDGEPTASTKTVTVTVKFIVHLRIPLLLREASDKFEKTLKTHFKYLEQAGIKAGMPSAVYVGFYSQDLMKQSVLDAFNWIRSNDPEAEILSYRNAVEGGEFVGAPGFEREDYADALFNGGDFLVAFSLEKEGE